MGVWLEGVFVPVHAGANIFVVKQRGASKNSLGTTASLVFDGVRLLALGVLLNEFPEWSCNHHPD